MKTVILVITNIIMQKAIVIMKMQKSMIILMKRRVAAEEKWKNPVVQTNLLIKEIGTNKAIVATIRNFSSPPTSFWEVWLLLRWGWNL